MFCEATAPSAPSRLQVSAIIPVATLRCETGRTRRLTFDGSGETAPDSRARNQEKFFLGQDFGLTERGFRDIGIGRRKQPTGSDSDFDFDFIRCRQLRRAPASFLRQR